MNDTSGKDTLRTLCLALIVGTLAGAAVATHIPLRELNALKTGELLLIDRAGQKRALLVLDARGKLGLELYDENGRQRMEVGHLGAGEDTPSAPRRPE